MKINFLLFTACVFFFLSSCASTNMKTNGTDSAAIQELSILKPVSYIEGINKGNQSELSDSLSYLSQVLLVDVLLQNQYRLPQLNPIEIIDDFDASVLAQQTVEFIDKLAVAKEIRQVPVPYTVTSTLDSENSRYGLLAVHSGFTRRKGNYGGQVAKAIGIGILTMGLYYPVPMKSNSTLYIAIVDNKTSEPVFFRTSVFTDKEPLDPAVINKHIDKLFKKYFW